MEKFKRFEEKGTGIVPFLPREDRQAVYRGAEKVSRAVRSYVLGPVLLAVRVPILAAAALLHVALSFILWAAIPVAFLRRPLQRVTDAVLLRVILACLGVWSPRSAMADPRRVVRSKDRLGRSSSPGSGVSPGHVLVAAPHSGPLEVLALAARHSPVFALPCNSGVPAAAAAGGLTYGRDGVYGAAQGGDAVAVRSAGTWGAFMHALRSPPEKIAAADDSAAADAVAPLAAAAGAPVVVFPEAVTHNGRGVLAFAAVLAADDVEARAPGGGGKAGAKGSAGVAGLHVAAVKSGAPFPAGSSARYIASLLMRPTTELEVRYFDSADLPARPETAGAASGSTWLAAAREGITSDLRIQKLDKGAADKWPFLTYFAEYVRK